METVKQSLEQCSDETIVSFRQKLENTDLVFGKEEVRRILDEIIEERGIWVDLILSSKQ